MTQLERVQKKQIFNGLCIGLWIVLLINELEIFGLKICCHSLHSDAVAWIFIFVCLVAWSLQTKSHQKFTMGALVTLFAFMSFSGLSFFSIRMVLDGLTNGSFCNLDLKSKTSVSEGQNLCLYSDGAPGRITASKTTLEFPLGSGFCAVKTLVRVSPLRH